MSRGDDLQAGLSSCPDVARGSAGGLWVRWLIGRGWLVRMVILECDDVGMVAITILPG